MNIFNEDNSRTKEFQRNVFLEDLLYKLNSFLECSEKKAIKKYLNEKQNYPIIFIMGPLRSGTTLFMQWLANTGIVSYPTNLLSRFYAAPVLGALIQKIFTDPRFNFRDEILEFNSPIFYQSENGKTKGALAPNEFWYFWRRFLPIKEIDWWSNDDLFRLVDKKTLVSELSALSKVFEKPFALKSMILNYNIPFLDAIFEQKLFIQIKRDPVRNVASILDARLRQSGSQHEWYSFKIPEYPSLKYLDPVKQCAGQLYYINKAVTKDVELLDESRKMEVQYEEFCQNPRQTFERLLKKLSLYVEDKDYLGPSKFEITRKSDIQNKSEIKTALEYFSAKDR